MSLTLRERALIVFLLSALFTLVLVNALSGCSQSDPGAGPPPPPDPFEDFRGRIFGLDQWCAPPSVSGWEESRWVLRDLTTSQCTLGCREAYHTRSYGPVPCEVEGGP